MFVRCIEFHSHITGVDTDTGVRIKEVNKSQKGHEQRHDVDVQAAVGLAKQTVAVVESIHRSLQKIEVKQRDARSEMEMAVVELAVLIAESIARRAIQADEFGVVALVQQAVARVKDADSVTIYLNPADIQLLEKSQAENELLDGLERGEKVSFENLDIQADSTLNRGDCYVDAGDLGMLTTVEQHLTDLRQWLLEGLDDGITTNGHSNT